jgi:hypothetical protein
MNPFQFQRNMTRKVRYPYPARGVGQGPPRTGTGRGRRAAYFRGSKFEFKSGSESVHLSSKTAHADQIAEPPQAYHSLGKLETGRISGFKFLTGNLKPGRAA